MVMLPAGSQCWVQSDAICKIALLLLHARPAQAAGVRAGQCAVQLGALPMNGSPESARREERGTQPHTEGLLCKAPAPALSRALPLELQCAVLWHAWGHCGAAVMQLQASASPALDA